MSWRGEKKKACISAGFLHLGSPVDHFGSCFRPASVAMISLSCCFNSCCPVGVLVKLVGWGMLNLTDKRLIKKKNNQFRKFIYA